MGYLVLYCPPSVLEPLQNASDTRTVPEFAGVYPPVYVCFPAPGGAVGYIPWPCGVCAVIVALLFEAFFVDETLVDVFDATLLSRHQEALLSPSRTIFPAASNSVKALGPPTEKAVYGPFNFRQIAEFVLFLPLNFIPFVGVPLFLVLTGRRAGPLQHWRYFKLRGLGRKERNKEVESRRWGYTWFGTIALLLQLVPVLSMFFLLTSAAGSALWVADLEEARQQRLLAAESVVGGAEVNDEFPPEYTDTEDQTRKRSAHYVPSLSTTSRLQLHNNTPLPHLSSSHSFEGHTSNHRHYLSVFSSVDLILLSSQSFYFANLVKMHFLVYLGFFFALCGISTAAPAALLQDGHLDKLCSVTTIYVTVTEDPAIPGFQTYDVAHHLAQTQNGEAVPDGLTTTITKTHTGFQTITVTINTSGVSHPDIDILESGSIRFLHDGPSPIEKEEHNVPATLTTTFQRLTETESTKIPLTANTTSQNLAVPTETDVSGVPLPASTASQYPTPATGTAATGDSATVNLTSQYLTEPTVTGSPTESQSNSVDDDVVVETLTVYPVKSISPETGSHDTATVPPTPHEPAPASLFPTADTPKQPFGVKANVTILSSSPSQTTLAAAAGFNNDQTKPLERKAALGAAPFAVATPNAPASTYMAPPANTQAPLSPLDAALATFTVKLPVTTFTFVVDLDSTATYTTSSTYIPGRTLAPANLG
ncbi:hypothetical protein V492_05551 [Pseudogymnoascus sp. VKM F-4246]|nr:hypothetical protein V492_05551 [Pseudogymnoascus sp. VKM F-4246]